MPDERDNRGDFLPSLDMKMPDYPIHPYCRGPRRRTLKKDVCRLPYTYTRGVRVRVRGPRTATGRLAPLSRGRAGRLASARVRTAVCWCGVRQYLCGVLRPRVLAGVQLITIQRHRCMTTGQRGGEGGSEGARAARAVAAAVAARPTARWRQGRRQRAARW